MKVRIGLTNVDRVIEIETDDPAAFEQSVDEMFAGDGLLLWFEDSKRRRVGVHRDRVAFVEVETEADQASVGFGRA